MAMTGTVFATAQFLCEVFKFRAKNPCSSMSARDTILREAGRNSTQLSFAFAFSDLFLLSSSLFPAVRLFFSVVIHLLRKHSLFLEDELAKLQGKSAQHLPFCDISARFNDNASFVVHHLPAFVERIPKGIEDLLDESSDSPNMFASGLLCRLVLHLPTHSFPLFLFV